MLRVAVLLASFLLLGFLVSLANDSLAPLQVHLFAGGLVVTYTGLRLDRRTGLITMFLAGLLADALAPVPTGTHAALFILAYLAIRRIRERIPANETAIQVAVALFANLGLFLLLSFVEIGASPAPGSAWLRLLVDLLASQLLLVAAGPWFLALQVRALRQFHVEPAALV